MNNKSTVIKFLLTLFYITLFSSIAYTQSKVSEITIKGNVIDTVSRIPISFATIKFLDSNEAIIKVSITTNEGSFIFRSPASVHSFLFISSTGYKPKSISIKSADTDSLINVGTIFLSPKASELKEVVVTAKAPVIKQEIDRISYNIQADPDSKTKNALEMMRKMPYLSIDAEENILLKGNRNYKIFINGKPSSLMENNPNDVLRSIPASTIQRIEIITTPSSKYDAEGMSGIINIVTIKKIGNGYNGSVNMYHRFPSAGSGMGISFTAKKGKFGISGFSGANYNTMLQTDYTNMQNSSSFSLLQNGYRKSNTKSGYAGANISYEIDSLNLITAQANANLSNNAGNEFQTTTINNTGVASENYKADNNGNSVANGFDAGLNYQLGFKANKSKLATFSYRYLSYTNKQDNKIQLSDKVNFNMPDFRQNNKGENKEHTVQLDLVQSFKNLYFEAGLKGIFRRNNSDFEYLKYNSLTNIFESDSSGSNEFPSNQNVVGAYNNYRFSIKSFSFQTGFRIEHTSIDADFRTTSTKIKQDYFNIIPSFAINKELKNKGNINLGFTQRIKRPGINRLNPFVDRSNPNFESTGNPNLKPVLNNDIMLGYSISKKASFNIGIGYSFSNNIDLKVSTFNPVTQITKTIYENTGKASRLGIDYNINYPATKNFNVSINGNVAYFWIEGFSDNALIKNNMLTYYVSLSAGYHFEKGWQMNSDMNVVSENPNGLQSKSNGFISSSFSISKNIMDNKLSFSAFTNNPFTKFRNNTAVISGKNFEQNYNAKEYFRAFGFSVNYKFGKLSDDIKKNRREIRNDDLSN